eukprot:SAG31_NODE_8300_length_1478_cov_1.134880_1_plen_72_part_00
MKFSVIRSELNFSCTYETGRAVVLPALSTDHGIYLPVLNLVVVFDNEKVQPGGTSKGGTTRTSDEHVTRRL